MTVADGYGVKLPYGQKIAIAITGPIGRQSVLGQVLGELRLEFVHGVFLDLADALSRYLETVG
jgi:hypothetical protein